MIRLDKVGTNSHIVSVKLAKDMKQGNVVAIGNKVDGEREIYNAAAPTTAATDKIVVLTTPFHPYSPLENEKDFVLKAGVPQRAHYLTSGDIITVTEDLIEGSPVKNQFVFAQDGKEKLKFSADLPSANTIFVIDDIEPSVSSFYGEKGIVLRVL